MINLNSFRELSILNDFKRNHFLVAMEKIIPNLTTFCLCLKSTSKFSLKYNLALLIKKCLAIDI